MTHESLKRRCVIGHHWCLLCIIVLKSQELDESVSQLSLGGPVLLSSTSLVTQLLESRCSLELSKQVS